MGSKVPQRKGGELPSVSVPAHWAITDGMPPTGLTRKKKKEAKHDSGRPNRKPGLMEIAIPEPVHRVAELDRVRMDVRPLSRLQRQGLVMLTSSLMEGEFFLGNGTKVSRQSHAIKWLLERFGEYAEK
jgi:hypothetical protein